MIDKGRYTFLDGIRGIAAMFVLTRHTDSFWTSGFWRSYLAVDLFFILSGFVIAYAYDKKLASGLLSRRDFVIIRLLRLYPVFFLSLIVCVVFASFIGINNGVSDYVFWRNFIAAAFVSGLFLPFRLEGSAFLFPINGTYWSLFFELLANFFYAVIRPKLSDFLLKAIVVVFGCMLVILALLKGNLNSGFLWGWGSFTAGISRSIFGVFFGLLLYRQRLNFLSLRMISPWIPVATICLILMSPSFGAADSVIDILSVCVIFPISVLIASWGESSAFDKVLIALGSASYPMYVFHKPFGEFISYLFNGTEAEYAPFSGVVMVAILIVLSVGLEKYIDLPFRKWMAGKVLFRRV